MHDSNCFITLTYDDENLPPDGSLHVEHWQLFAKQLRNKVGRFRFFHCGEYGDQLGRPHYHACIFGHDFSGDRTYFTRTKRGDTLWNSKVLDSCWKKGYAVIGDLSYESACYVARYCVKKVTGGRKKEHYERVDEETGEITELKQEYTTMSRRPGLGAEWIEEFYTDVYPRDFVVVRGREQRPPKFYDGEYEKKAPDRMEAIKERRIEENNEKLEEQTPERLKIREKVAKAKLASHAKRK